MPKLAVAAGWASCGTIAITQPRRVAAVAIAKRLRDEMQVEEPVVAHAVRFDERSTTDTVFKICTDGLLLAEMGRDPWLNAYDAIILDEAHERSVTIDVLLGSIVQLRKKRPDLRLLVMSASLMPNASLRI